jgi:3-hydroxybutyrate dehydrogenase
MVMRAGDEGVEGFEAMDEALLLEEIQRAIDRDGGRGTTRFLAHRLDEIIGAEWLLAFNKRFQNQTALRREARAIAMAGILCRAQHRIRAVVRVGMIVMVIVRLMHGPAYSHPDRSWRGRSLWRNPLRAAKREQAKIVAAEVRCLAMETSMSLKGKCAVITGSTSGIGLGVARALAAQGVHVMLNGLGDAAAIEAVRASIASEFGVKALYHGANMLEAAEIRDLIKTAQAELGAVDILVNNAGIQFVSPVEDFPDDKWDQIIRINLSASFHAIKAAVPGMKARGGGRIINISSAHSLVASPFKSAYVAAKHGVAGLTKTVALEVAQAKITVNAIAPGYVWTPLVEKQIPDTMKARNMTEEEVKKIVLLAAQPTKEFVTIEQVASLAVYLASDAAASITGTTVSMDGGWTAQ